MDNCERNAKWINLILCVIMNMLFGAYGGGIGQEQNFGPLVFLKPDWPVCPSEPAKCISIYQSAPLDDPFYAVYEVNDNTITLTYNDGSITIECKNHSLLDRDFMPRYNNEEFFFDIKIINCKLPNMSYITIFNAMNMTLNRELLLEFDFPVNLTSKAFENLSVDQISIAFTEDNYLVPVDSIFDDHLSKILILKLRNVSLPPISSFNVLNVLTIETGIIRGKWQSCDSLQSLTLKNVRFDTNLKQLSQIFNCPYLNYVNFKNISITELRQGMFGDLSYVTDLTIESNKLERISPNFFDELNELRFLYLRENNLQNIPMRTFFPLTSLVKLVLDKNPLGDLCGEEGFNLGRLPSLLLLSLDETEAVRMCSNWQSQLPKLKEIDLVGNKIREIEFGQFRDLDKINLTSNPLEAVRYTKDDYEFLINKDKLHPKSYTRMLWFDSPLKCDCRSYWFAVTLRDNLEHITLSKLPQCEQGDNIFSIRYSGNSCLLPQSDCNVGCECRWYLDSGIAVANCAGAALRTLPKIDNITQMIVTDNRITEIDANLLADSLQYIDFEHNQISRVDEVTLKKLFEGNRRVRLAGNPFICGCEDQTLIQFLQSHREQVSDFYNVTCVNGKPVSTLEVNDICERQLAMVLAIAVGTVAATALALGITFFRYKQQIKLYLFSKGWCLRWVHEEDIDKEKKYDAFISYSHKDEKFVYEKIIRVLESEKYGFSFCVHTRDWIVGEWIPSQITHSVEQSRRTLIVLSRNFLKSVWGRLEFRTAHVGAVKEGRARVVIVLLEDLEVLQGDLDGELRSYLASNTYVQWGDPKFYEKLCYSLPCRIEENRSEKQLSTENVLKCPNPYEQSVL